MENISFFTLSLFIITTIVTVGAFYKAAHNSQKTLTCILIWAGIVSILGITGFYQKPDVIPPRIMFLLAPNVIIIFLLFGTKPGRNFIDGLDLKWLTLLHIVRIPVEICLYLIYVAGLIPVEMTFEGFNWDILSGITAIFIYYFAFVKKRLTRKVFLIWNIACLALLFNIIVIAVLSGKSPIQQIGFDQPNVGVTYFPFVLLPTLIVLLVLIAHFAAIKRLLKNDAF
jgi:hypothetical protein